MEIVLNYCVIEFENVALLFGKAPANNIDEITGFNEVATSYWFNVEQL